MKSVEEPLPEANITKCWICRVNDANTGEHMIKHSDLRAVLGTPDTEPTLLLP